MRKKKVLIIRFRRVGDAVLTSSICTSLKQSIPNVEIHYVLNENIAPLFEHHPDIDKLITFSHDETHSFFKYVKKVRKIMKEGHYDIIIDTRTTMNTMYFPLFSLGSKYRIGKKKKYSVAYNYLVNNFYRGDMDNVQLLLKMLNPLKKEFEIKKNPNFKLYCTEKEKLSFQNYMVSEGINLNDPIIVCAVTSRIEKKRWDRKKMKEILDRILSNYSKAQLIFNYGGEAEKKYAIDLYKEMAPHSRIFIDIEAKNLRELAALFSNTNFFFGNEGGPRHISQAFDVPSFAIYPPNIPKEEWLPNKSDRFEGIEPRDIDPVIALDDSISYDDKFNLISVDEVWNRLDTMLKKYLN